MKGAGRVVKLSKRLEMVASFVKPGSRVADVGTDHGFIPVELVLREVAVTAVAMDVRPGPLERAKEHIRQYGLEEKIEARLGDGVEKLCPGEADTVIIAGMGGRLVIHILEHGRHLWRDGVHWILSPQSDLDKVRMFLYESGFDIVKEDMVAEDQKYYTVMDAVYVGMEPGAVRELTNMEYLYGPKLIEEKNKVLMEFLERERGQLGGIVKRLEGKEGEKAWARRKELEKRIDEMEEILDRKG